MNNKAISRKKSQRVKGWGAQKQMEGGGGMGKGIGVFKKRLPGASAESWTSWDSWWDDGADRFSVDLLTLFFVFLYDQG